VNRSDVFSIKYIALDANNNEVSNGIIGDEITLEKVLGDVNALSKIEKELYAGRAISLVNTNNIEDYVKDHKISTPPMGRNHSRSIIVRYLIESLAQQPHKTDEELDVLKKDIKYKLFHRVLADMDCKARARPCGAIMDIVIDTFGENFFDYDKYQKYYKNNVYNKHHGESNIKESFKDNI